MDMIAQPQIKCRLCKSKPADQTGSHIFSWFLIRDAVNKAGEKGRDNEIVFSISENEFVSTYFGKDQSNPDAVTRIRGHELTEEEIEKMKSSNPFTRDNILCRECEARLQTLESIVSVDIIAALRKHPVKKVTGVDVVEVEKSELLRLFIYSLLWRGAVSHINDFEMESEHEEVLRSILDANLDLKKDLLIKNLVANSSAIKNIPLIVTFTELIGNNDNFIYCSHNFKPYAMILNDLSFQLYFDNAVNNGFDIKLGGINDVISKRALTNKNERRLKVGVLSNEKRQLINYKLAIFIGARMFENGNQIFAEGFKKIYGTDPSKHLIALFQQRVISDNNGLIEGFTPEQFTQAAIGLISEISGISPKNKTQ